MVTAKYLSHLPRDLLLLRAGLARRLCLFRAHPVTVKRLTTARLSRRVQRVLVCREGQARLLHHPHLPDLCQQPGRGCLPRARRRESAAECSLDFHF